MFAVRAFVQHRSVRRSLVENVAAGDMEVPRCLEHVAIVGVNLPEAVLRGTGQVKRIDGPNDDGAWKARDPLAGLLQE